MILERNYTREGTMSKGSKENGAQWWSESYNLFGLHVWTSDGQSWHWRLNAMGFSSAESTQHYATKEAAYEDALKAARERLIQDLDRVGSKE